MFFGGWTIPVRQIFWLVLHVVDPLIHMSLRHLLYSSDSYLEVIPNSYSLALLQESVLELECGAWQRLASRSELFKFNSYSDSKSEHECNTDGVFTSCTWCSSSFSCQCHHLFHFISFEIHWGEAPVLKDLGLSTHSTSSFFIGT